jgi:hypothetical protein
MASIGFKQSKATTIAAPVGKAHVSAAKPALIPSAAEMLLAAFDLDQSFGPCVGLSRAARWERARALGLSPPAEVLAALEMVGAAQQSVFARAMGVA